MKNRYLFFHKWLKRIIDIIVWKLSTSSSFKKKTISYNDVPTVMRNLIIFTIVICVLNSIYNIASINSSMDEVCAFVHKNKGYSPIAGFCWGFFFSVIGLIVVLLEKDKTEHEADMANKKGLSMRQWLAIFLGIGIVGIIIFFVVISNL